MSRWLDRREAHLEEAFALGLASLHTQRIEMAIRENEEAIRINPSYAAALTNLGNCNNWIDRPAVAVDCVARAIRLSPVILACSCGRRPLRAVISCAAS